MYIRGLSGAGTIRLGLNAEPYRGVRWKRVIRSGKPGAGHSLEHCMEGDKIYISFIYALIYL